MTEKQLETLIKRAINSAYDSNKYETERINDYKYVIDVIDNILVINTAYGLHEYILYKIDPNKASELSDYIRKNGTIEIH